MNVIKGILTHGHGTAAKHLEMQKKHFYDLPAIANLYMGSINLKLAPPLIIKKLKFSHFYFNVRWRPEHEGYHNGEDFGFVTIKQIKITRAKYFGLIRTKEVIENPGYLIFPSGSDPIKVYGQVELWVEFIDKLYDGIELELVFDEGVIDAEVNKGQAPTYELTREKIKLENYQDIWFKGKQQQKGIRECEKRYEALLNAFPAIPNPALKVLDIGACYGYFSIRLAEKYPASTFHMIESPVLYANKLNEILIASELENVFLFSHHIEKNLEELKSQLPVPKYDVILALSVLHHVPGSNIENINFLMEYGKVVIIELPVEKNAHNAPKVKELLELWDLIKQQHDVKQIGSAKSHIGEVPRPIYMLTKRGELTNVS